MTGQQRPASYQVRVRGHLGAATQRAFPAVRAETRGRDTLLEGIADQAALYGVLARVEALGLELLEVRRLAALRATEQRHDLLTVLRSRRVQARARLTGSRRPGFSGCIWGKRRDKPAWRRRWKSSTLKG
jgi:hypothetical protein